MEKRIFVALNLMGMPMHLTGREYIEYGVSEIIKNPKYKESAFKYLYPVIGEKFGEDVYKVDRSIRYAIRETFKREDYKKYFSREPKPFEFIVSVARLISVGVL